MDWRKENKEINRIIIYFFLFIFLSCAKNYNNIYNNINKTNNFNDKLILLEKLKNEYYQYYFLKGIIFFNNEIYDSAFICFQNAEKFRRQKFDKNTLKNIEKFLLNSNAEKYFGEDYEDLMLNYYKSLIFAQKNNFEDAAIESRIINQKLKLFNNIYKKLNSQFNYNIDYPFIEYISGIFYLFEEEYDDAYISFKMADSLYNISTYQIEKPKFLDSLLFYTKNGKEKLNNMSFIIYQKGRISKKYEQTILKTLPVKNRIYQIKISYPEVKYEKSQTISIEINENKYNIYPQENLSQREYYMLENKKNMIISIAVIQASIKLLFSAGMDYLAYKLTKEYLENEEENNNNENEKQKNKKNTDNYKKKNNSIESFANLAGCLAGSITNQYLNSMTKADIRQIILLPEEIYIIPIIDKNSKVKINGKNINIKKRMVFINDY